MARKPRWGQSGKSIAVYLPQEQVDLLTQLAEEEQTNVSELVRRAIRRYFLPSNARTTSVECKM